MGAKKETWTVVAQFCIGRQESALTMLVVPLGESVKMKVKGDVEVDLSGYRAMPDDDGIPDGFSVDEDEEEENIDDDEDEEGDDDDDGSEGDDG